MIRKIIHVDMDAFFASVEQRDNSALRGRPIAVGFDGPRGVVTTASYEARPYGVHSAMSMSRAKQLCPDLIITPVRMQRYKEISSQIHKIFREYTDLIEPISIDEAFLDVTNNKAGIEMAKDVAIEIKRKIFETTGLTASAGVSYNKFLAKVASDYNKPNGLMVVHPLRALDFIARLPVEDFWGVGPKTAEKMHHLRISNGLELREKTLEFLTHHFGKAGKIYYDFARGIDERRVETTRIRKSVGCEETFLNDIYVPDQVEKEIRILAEDLVRRREKAGFQGRTLTVKVKYQDFSQITRSITMPNPLNEYDEIKETADRIMDHIDYSSTHKIRLLGLSLGNPEHHIKRDKFPTHPRLFEDFNGDVM